MTRHIAKVGIQSPIILTRNQADLPFYCKPAQLFFAVWLMMLITAELKISYTSYPVLGPAVLLFVVSGCSFLLSYCSVKLAYSAIYKPRQHVNGYRIDITNLHRFQVLCGAVTVAIVILNLKLYGLPPVFGFFGAETFEYGEYGSLKQLLFPAFMALFVTAPLEPSRGRRWFLYGVGPVCAMAYASRGYLLIMLFQILAMFSLRTSISRKRLYVVAVSTLALAIELSDVIGNSRSTYGSAALLGYMQIKTAYYRWPTAYLWLISYVSSPISNMCWIIRSRPYDHTSLTFLYNLAPGFLHIKGLEALDLGSDNIVDGVHTYLAKYYLDLSWLGVFGINYLWGLISGLITVRGGTTKYFLISSVLLSCLGFIFFADFLTFLLIAVELAVLAWGQSYFINQEHRDASPEAAI